MTGLDPAQVTLSPGVAADTWREAVRAAGVDLVNARAAGPAYADAMVALIEDSGPWCVVAPGVALAHARPSALVRKDALAIVTLRTPVAFGHPHHDPVRVVIGVAGTSQAAHIRQLASLANALDRPGTVDALADATTVGEALTALERG